MLLFGHLGITLGVAWILERKFRMDYRLIVLGSLLPDIIDKTFGFLIFLTGRALAHSFLFPLFIALFCFWRRSFAYLAFASFLHLLEDEMWRSSTFYFPFRNLEVKEVELNDYVAKTLNSYFVLSKTFFFEAIGAIIIFLFILFRLKVLKRLKTELRKIRVKLKNFKNLWTS